MLSFRRRPGFPELELLGAGWQRGLAELQGGCRLEHVPEMCPLSTHGNCTEYNPVCSLASEQHAWQCARLLQVYMPQPASTHGPFGHSCPVTCHHWAETPRGSGDNAVKGSWGRKPRSSSAELGKLTQIWATRAGFSEEGSTKLKPERCPCHSEEKEGQRVWAARESRPGPARN